MTITYVFPFDHAPSREEADGQKILIVDVQLDPGEAVAVLHYLGLPSADPIVTLAPLTGATLTVAFTDPETLTVYNVSTDPAAARVYIQPLRIAA